MTNRARLGKFYGGALADGKDIELLVEVSDRNIEFRICSLVDTLMLFTIDNEGVKVLATVATQVFNSLSHNQTMIGCMTIDAGKSSNICISMAYDGSADSLDLHFYRGIHDNHNALMIQCSRTKFEQLVNKMLVLSS